MMTTSILKACFHEIQKLQCSFICGDSEEYKRVHSMERVVMVLSKFLGELDIRRLDVMNNACLLKLGWAIRSNEESLCCEGMCGK